MALTFEPANPAITALVYKTLQANFPELNDEGVSIGILLASKTNRHGESIHALQKDGHVVGAQISITSKQDRARGIADAKLVIDELSWRNMKDSHRAAVIDHELRHLRLAQIRPTKRNGFMSGVKHDDLGRPVLRPQPHDWVITGFAKTAELYGNYSLEARQFANFRAEYGQQLELFGETIASVVLGNGDVKQIESSGKAIGKSRPAKKRQKKVE